MPGYSEKAQPYLDAIAEGMFQSGLVRDWLLRGTPAETAYLGADILHDEQRAARHKKKITKQPFWANYWCGLDAQCQCRIEGSKSLESDAIFFLRNAGNRTLAIHVEFKHDKEPFIHGQPEGYPLRADCFQRTAQQRSALLPHDDWVTVLFGGESVNEAPGVSYFHRVITHGEAGEVIPRYPSISN